MRLLLWQLDCAVEVVPVRMIGDLEAEKLNRKSVPLQLSKAFSGLLPSARPCLLKVQNLLKIASLVGDQVLKQEAVKARQITLVTRISSSPHLAVWD